MNYNKLPAPVLATLLEREQRAKQLADRVAEMQDGIASARARLTGGFEKQSEYADLRASLRQMVGSLPALKTRCDAAQATLSGCKVWLDRLPEGTVLEPVQVKTDGRDLEEVRARIKTAEAELAALRAVPVPSADIEERVRAYVHSMARPTISGVGSGERLKVIWPGAGWDSSGPREHRADVLPLIATLHSDAMVAALMREVERMADEPLPRAERIRRIAALETELAELAYVEEALIAAAIASGDDVHSSPGAPPQAVLGIRIMEAKKSRAA
jgi:hypothetical protein